jgi:hypothetical protein
MYQLLAKVSPSVAAAALAAAFKSPMVLDRASSFGGDGSPDRQTRDVADQVGRKGPCQRRDQSTCRPFVFPSKRKRGKDMTAQECGSHSIAGVADTVKNVCVPV